MLRLLNKIFKPVLRYTETLNLTFLEIVQSRRAGGWREMAATWLVEISAESETAVRGIVSW
jgi:hypothetical protein